MKRTISVGGSLEDVTKRVADVWNRAARGEKVEPYANVTFLSWSALFAVMTDKRHELLCYLHTHPTAGVRALSRALGRDYKRVHEDVQALKSIGLIETKGKILHADYDEIRTSLFVGGEAA